MPSSIDSSRKLSPQIREVYEALLENGHTEEALDLAKRDMNGDLDLCIPDGTRYNVNYDYMLRKKIFIRNLWIHIIAKRLEDLDCARMEQPCDRCLSTARKIGPVVWKIMESWFDQAQAHTTTWTDFQALYALEEIMKLKNTTATLHTYEKMKEKPAEPDLRIKKAPDLEELDE